MAVGRITLSAVMRLPKPCRMMKAGRRSPALTPSGMRMTPASSRPLEVKLTLCSDIGLSRICCVEESRGEAVRECHQSDAGRPGLHRFVGDHLAPMTIECARKRDPAQELEGAGARGGKLRALIGAERRAITGRHRGHETMVEV